MTGEAPAGRRHERGVALLLVLWTMVLLGLLATALGSNARTEVMLARNLLENAQAEALADAGVYRAVAGLVREPQEGGLKGDGTVYIWREPADANATPALDGTPAPTGEVRFYIRDEGGKLDLNQATEASLSNLLEIVGVDPGRSEALAAAIIDFRDEDDQRAPKGGAEQREYRSAGLTFGPKNAAFELLDELAYVYGMTAETYRALEPFVTVYSQQDQPHLRTAPREVVAALRASSRGGRSAGRDGQRAGDEGQGAAQRDSAFSSSSGSGSRFGSGSSSFGRSGHGSGSSSSGFGGSGFGSGFGTGSSFGSGSGSGGNSRFSSGLGGRDDEDGETGGGGFGNDESEDASERSGVGIFTVHAEARTVAGTVFVRDAVIDFASTDDRPFVMHAWKQGERVLFPPDPPPAGTAAPAQEVR